jgi:hypothetical protein
MVDVAHGRSGWSGSEGDHLRDCADCAAEWHLIARAAALGEGLELDVERVADAVVRRLAAQPASTPSRRGAWVLGLAAAAAAIVIVLFEAGPRRAPEAAPAAAPTVLSELDDLTHDELLTVLDALDPPPADGGAVPEASRLEGLSPGELERVLRSLEG